MNTKIEKCSRSLPQNQKQNNNKEKDNQYNNTYVKSDIHEMHET